MSGARPDGLAELDWRKLTRFDYFSNCNLRNVRNYYPIFAKPGNVEPQGLLELANYTFTAGRGCSDKPVYFG